MSYRGEFPVRISVAGQNHESSIVIDSDNHWGKNTAEFPAAKPGTLSTRTDNNTGTLTMEGGHGITTGDLVDIFWTDGNGDVQSQKVVTVGTVSGNSVPFDLGSGTNLPAQGTSVTVMVLQYEPVVIGANNISSITISSTGKLNVHVYDDGLVYVSTIVVEAGGCFSWNNQTGLTTPIAIDVSGFRFSQPLTETIALKMDVQFDN
jgi:hypothetical protein